MEELFEVNLEKAESQISNTKEGIQMSNDNTIAVRSLDDDDLLCDTLDSLLFDAEQNNEEFDVEDFLRGDSNNDKNDFMIRNK